MRTESDGERSIRKPAFSFRVIVTALWTPAMPIFIDDIHLDNPRQNAIVTRKLHALTAGT
jgi:hypothetical protein